MGMAVRTFEINLRAALLMTVKLFVSLATTTALNPGYKLYREVAFTSQQMNFTKKVCSTQNPDQVFKRIRSSIECTVLCKGTAGCSGVNWKKPSTCELNVARRRSFVVASSCTYFGLGKEFKFETFCQQFIHFIYPSSLLLFRWTDITLTRSNISAYSIQLWVQE